MNQADRSFALRMIPYGVHVVTALAPDGTIEAATVHWVTQTSFVPPVVAVALPAGGYAYDAIRATNRFALHMLGRDDAPEAHSFQSRRAIREGESLSGWRFSRARSGLPLLDNAVAVLECELRAVLEFGDHHPMIAEVVDAHVRLPEQERPDRMMLHLRELGEKVFYGG
jgi:flavin reductase (DIM6/NTAB) family NADH-FMN oxidoreductase RutF